MLDLLLVPVAVVYLAVIGSLFIYSLNFYYLTVRALFRSQPHFRYELPAEWPQVVVQLPVYNERYVVHRLLKAATALDYPRTHFSVQVLDDSTDDTVGIIAAMVQRIRESGVRIEHIHRDSRVGFKAGALAAGLHTSDAEFIAMFDADFVPDPDFLQRVMPYFADPSVAFVQGRWGHLNRTFSPLTLLQSLSIDAHFMIEQSARSISDWFNFNGTAGIWRRAALEDAGGWSADTLTEDLDLSYRAFLRGWNAVYCRDIEVPAELPVAFSAYRRQQSRWARGSFECAYKLLPPIWNSDAGVGRKVQATLHLTGYAVHLLMFVLAILYPILLFLSQRYGGLLSLSGIATLFNVTMFAPAVLFLAAQEQLGRRWWQLAPLMLIATALGAGLMVNTVRAALLALLKTSRVFERTPKFGVTHRRQGWANRRYQVGLDGIVFTELAAAVYTGATAYFAFATTSWVIGVYASLFCISLATAAYISIAQSIALRPDAALGVHP